MEPADTFRCPSPSTAISSASWIKGGLQKLARAASSLMLSRHNSTLSLPRHRHAAPLRLQHAPIASSGAPLEPGDPVGIEGAEGAQRGAPVRESAADSDSSAGSRLPGEGGTEDAGKEIPQLHFCDYTNEPEDVCNAQWLVLWSYAAYAPERANAEEQQMLRSFFEFFPDQCTQGPAANCYTDAVRNTPPKVHDRRELLLWLCMVENQCRLKAGIPLKQCRHNELLKRWRYMDGYV
ncbi:uncharacterized protein LOC34617867 [Cyclospora cayetanensis]|uniref:Uncharacterized protein LOC34617867 n=2 Tax=Cyclospora cayetanensis TaxID=88456 RepID=A0A6P5WCT5_9EIME|nr:uncharacterized protein LOC34617867 [Cyclospora cayetanensis]OEH75030.1 ERV1 alr family domain-containing protein [Cyclospora cayetanensis]